MTENKHTYDYSLLDSRYETNNNKNGIIEWNKDEDNILYSDLEDIVEKLNFKQMQLEKCRTGYKKLLKENEQLKKELFKTKKDYLIETSDEVDRVLYVPDEIEELRENIFEKGVYDD